MTSRPAIPFVIDRHCEDAAFLWLQRDAAVSEPHYDLNDLAELDGRLEAHLDGLRVSGDYGWQAAEEALSLGEPGEVFVAAWLAVAALDGGKLDRAMAAAQSNRQNQRALISALAWQAPHDTASMIRAMLNANDSEYLALGIATCALHRIDPGEAISIALKRDHERLIARTLRAIGELGRRDLLPELARFSNSETASHHFWANWSAALLGDSRARALLAHHIMSGSE